MPFRRPAVACLLAVPFVVACHKDKPKPGITTDGPSAATAHAETAVHKDPKGPPDAAPKPKASTPPKLPSLPTLAAQEKPPGKAAPRPSKEYPCGSVWDGKKHYPLSCLHDAEKNHGPTERTVSVLVPYDRLKAQHTHLPRYVDHRLDGTEGGMRNQGGAAMCTSFGTAAVIDHSVARWTGKPSYVSVMHIWARYRDTSLKDAISGSVGKTLASEETWPFDGAAWTWHTCPPNTTPGNVGTKCGVPVDAAHLATAEGKPVVSVEQAEWLPWSIDLIRLKLAAGQDLVFALNMPTNAHFAPTGDAGAKYIPHFDQSKPGHIMVIAGYWMMPREGGGGAGGDNYYLLHNSFGPEWGDGGYAWIHEATLQKNNQGGFGTIDARLVGDGVAAHRSRHRKSAGCKGDHAPDSETGVCTARCPDRSPRHDNVCADPSDCPKGFVNLTGACVLAAPVEAGEDPTTRLKWDCGPGGCVYSLPKGVGGPEASVVSCPAPAFRVAKDHQGLTCVE